MTGSIPLTRLLQWILRPLRALGRALALVGAGLVKAKQELVFFAGLLLLAAGAAKLHPAAGYLTAGALLVWISIPTRRFPVDFSRSTRES